MKCLRIHRTFFWIGACLVMSAAGCSEDQHDHPKLITGEQLYNFHCAKCHRKDGTGILFDSRPANILSQKSPEEMITYITTDTNHNRLMPAFKSMPLDEAEFIAEHLGTLKTAYEQRLEHIPH